MDEQQCRTENRMLLYHLLGFCWLKNIENWLSTKVIEFRNIQVQVSYCLHRKNQLSFRIKLERKMKHVQKSKIMASKHTKNHFENNDRQENRQWWIVLVKKGQFWEEKLRNIDWGWPIGIYGLDGPGAWNNLIDWNSWSKAINFVIFNQKQKDSNPVALLPGHAKTA